VRPGNGDDPRARFSPALVARVEDLWTRYPHRKAALIPAI
jgi:hypothetical protein